MKIYAGLSLLEEASDVITYCWRALPMVTAGQDLIQRNAKGPNVRGKGEFILLQALNGIPIQYNKNSLVAKVIEQHID